MSKIDFIDRESGLKQTEKVMGESLVKAAFGDTSTAVLLSRVVSTEVMSKIIGLFHGANRESSAKKILGFIEEFGINMNDFHMPNGGFRNFQEFFTRALRHNARPIDPNEDTIIFPADARHLVFPNIENTDSIYVKGQTFDLRKFVDNDELYEKFRDGSAIFSRLCPVDYHRFHFPVSGEIQKNHLLVQGILGSVSPIALKNKLAYLWENRRWITEIQTHGHGSVLMIEIGATNVGSAQFLSLDHGHKVKKGDEKGQFQLGGSFVICIFEKGKMQFDGDLIDIVDSGYEAYAKMGTSCGTWIK